jgi:transcriptional regulator with XRE-family HTH domain
VVANRAANPPYGLVLQPGNIPPSPFLTSNTQYTGLSIDAKCSCLLAMSLSGIVARNIRRLRLEGGLSQEALAVDAGIDRTYVSRLERGLENPTISVLEKLARALSAKSCLGCRRRRPAGSPHERSDTRVMPRMAPDIATRIRATIATRIRATLALPILRLLKLTIRIAVPDLRIKKCAL